MSARRMERVEALAQVIVDLAPGVARICVDVAHLVDMARPMVREAWQTSESPAGAPARHWVPRTLDSWPIADKHLRDHAWADSSGLVWRWEQRLHCWNRGDVIAPTPGDGPWTRVP